MQIFDRWPTYESFMILMQLDHLPLVQKVNCHQLKTIPIETDSILETYWKPGRAPVPECRKSIQFANFIWLLALNPDVTARYKQPVSGKRKMTTNATIFCPVMFKMSPQYSSKQRETSKWNPDIYKLKLLLSLFSGQLCPNPHSWLTVWVSGNGNAD